MEKGEQTLLDFLREKAWEQLGLFFPGLSDTSEISLVINVGGGLSASSCRSEGAVHSFCINALSHPLGP